MSNGYKRTHESGYDKRKKDLYNSKQSESICKFLTSQNITVSSADLTNSKKIDNHEISNAKELISIVTPNSKVKNKSSSLKTE